MTVHSRVGPVLVKRNIPEICLLSEGLQMTIPLLCTAIRCVLLEDLGVNWQEMGCNFDTSLRKSGFSMRRPSLARFAQHRRAAGSCCGSSQPREGTWPQPYRLDKAFFTSQYPWDRVRQVLHALESVSPPLPSACMAASSSASFALSKRTWSPCKASASKATDKCLCSALHCGRWAQSHVA